MTRNSSSIDLRRGVLARRAEPRLRLSMLLTVSTCQRWAANSYVAGLGDTNYEDLPAPNGPIPVVTGVGAFSLTADLADGSPI